MEKVALESNFESRMYLPIVGNHVAITNTIAFESAWNFVNKKICKRRSPSHRTRISTLALAILALGWRGVFLAPPTLPI